MLMSMFFFFLLARSTVANSPYAFSDFCNLVFRGDLLVVHSLQ